MAELNDRFIQIKADIIELEEIFQKSRTEWHKSLDILNLVKEEPFNYNTMKIQLKLAEESMHSGIKYFRDLVLMIGRISTKSENILEEKINEYEKCMAILMDKMYTDIENNSFPLDPESAKKQTDQLNELRLIDRQVSTTVLIACQCISDLMKRLEPEN